MSFTGHNFDGTPAGSGTDNNGNTVGGPQHSLTGNETVLAVHVRGRPPYAVFEEHFKAPKDRPVFLNPRLYAWLPGLVSDLDPSAIEIVWEEVPKRMEQVGQIAEHRVAAQIAHIREIAPLPETPVQSGAAGAQLPAEVQAMLDRSAQQAAKASAHAPPELRGAIDQAMAFAAERLQAANQMTQAAAEQPAAAASEWSPEAKQMMIDAARRMAPAIAQLPKAIQGMQLEQMRTSLDAAPPDTREACLEIYRAAGLKI